MSYGSVYIRNDIQRLKAKGLNEELVVNALAKRLRARYPDCPQLQAKMIIRKIYQGKETTADDWTW